jgi:hypothetical protein
VLDEIAIDLADFPSRGGLARGGGEAIDVAKRAGGGLVEHGHGVRGKEVAIGAGTAGWSCFEPPFAPSISHPLREQ